MSHIPLVDLKAQFVSIERDVRAAIDGVLESQSFIQGRRVESFETAFAKSLDVGKCVGCSSGTTALALALEVAGIGQGDEVIVPSHTFFATVEPILKMGAVPMFVDVDPERYTMDPGRAKAAITPRTAAIVPVHIYGIPADVEALEDLADDNDLVLIEDAAQAHLASIGGRRVGTYGTAAAFSFYPGKNLGAYGDAGAVTTDDEDLSTRMQKLLNHGRSSKYEHDMVGYNYRMDEIQAAVLEVKLAHLDAWTTARRAFARMYDERFATAGFQVIPTIDRVHCVYHLYVVQVSNRDEVMAHLSEAGIASGIHYPVPVHAQIAMRGTRSDPLPVTDALVDRIISLPMYAELSEDQIDRISETFLEVARP